MNKNSLKRLEKEMHAILEDEKTNLFGEKTNEVVLSLYLYQIKKAIVEGDNLMIMTTYDLREQLQKGEMPISLKKKN